MQARFTVGGLLCLVAYAGVCTAAFRLNLLLGCFTSCVFGMAFQKTLLTANRLRARGFTARRSEVIRGFVCSSLIASLILAISLVPMFFTLPLLMGAERSHGRPDIGWTQVLGFMSVGVMSIPIFVLLKRQLW